MKNRIDLGEGFFYSFFQWDPDRRLNPQYKDIADIEKAGIIIWRLEPRQSDQVIDDDAPEGMVWTAVASCWFDTPETRAIPGEKTAWELHSLDPLHIEPSIQMYDYVYGDGPKDHPSYHGWIRDGKWVNA